MSTGKNKYYVRSHISEKLFRRLIRLFALDLTASEAAAMTGLSVRGRGLSPPRHHKRIHVV
jgi:hypothetical protein